MINYEAWVRAQILGRAHNNIGYIHSREDRHTEAVAEYEEALRFFEEAEIHSLRADTLKNQAMSLARLGKFFLARMLAEEAEEVYSSLGMRYGEALTLNTRGLIMLQTQEQREAEPLCRRALEIFSDLGDARGIGLASIGLGWALRKRGGLAPRYSQDVDESFDQARNLLEGAIDIFENKAQEPVRLVEAYSELGRTYRDQVNLYRKMNVGQPERISELEDLAEQNLAESIELAAQHSLRIAQADSLEDLAEIAFVRGDYAKAERLLDESDGLIPAEYQIKRKGSLPSPPQPDSIFWFLLGKNSLLRGRVAFAQKEPRKAMRSNLFTYLYFELYSVDSIEAPYTGWTSGTRRILSELRELSREEVEGLREYIEAVASEYGASEWRGTDKVRRLLADALKVSRSGGPSMHRGVDR